MEKNVLNAMNFPEYNSEDEEWESIPENEQTQETKDILYRLNIEGASKIRLDINKKKNYHSSKVKKLDLKEKESFNELNKYIKEKYIPNISITQNINSNPFASILNDDYIIKKHPEIGTCLIYEMDESKKEAKLIGKSDTWYETTILKPKLSSYRKPIKNNINIAKISKSLNLAKKIKKEKDNSKDQKVNNSTNKIGNLPFLKKKTKRKKKIKYPSNSTIIEIKRIFDNQNTDNSINIKEENKEK